MQTLNILMIEDVEADFLLTARHIRNSGLEATLHWVKNEAELTKALDVGPWDLVLSDYKVIGLDFLETFALVKARLPGVPVILISGSVGEETAVELLKTGLTDFILKDHLARLVPAIERCLEEEAEKRKRREAEAALRHNEFLMRSVLEGTSDAVFVKDREGRYILFNDAAGRLTDRDDAEVIGRDDSFLFSPETAKRIREIDRAIMAGARVQTHEEEVQHLNGETRTYQVTKGPVFDSQGKVNGIFGISRDVSAHKQDEKTRLFNFHLLELVHRHTDISELISEFVDEVGRFTGCEAVGIRVLDEQGNIPYQAYQGFGPQFFDSESPLSIKSDRCMCVNVIKGDTDPAQPFYTPGGSFYMNGTTRFLATVDPKAKGMTRNVCNAAGYESVALIPFRKEKEILGLIHVADRKDNMVPLPLVELLEGAMLQLGTAFERAHAQMKLRENESRLQAIIDNASGIVWVKDLAGRFLVVNDYLVHLLQRPREKVLGRTVFDLLPREEAEEQAASDRQVQGAGFPLEVEQTIVLADGRHTFLTVKFPLHDAQGRMHALGAICTDITKLKQTEAQLQHQQEEYRRLSQAYRTLLDNVPDGIVHLSPDLGVLWANTAAQKMFALEAKELPAGTPCHVAFWNRAECCPSCPVERCIASHGNEIACFSPKGDDRQLEFRAVPVVDGDGSMEGVIEIIRDVTAHHKLEEQFRQAQKMESIGTLAGGIAHDFNNILSAILGYAELALEDMAEDHPARKSVHTIMEAGRRAAHLTKDLLMFSRKQVSQKEPVDINALIARIEKLIRRVIGEDIQFETHLAKQPLIVSADSHQIDQVLMNFATNARDAMPAGGYLSISTERLECDRDFFATHGFGGSGPYVRIAVADTGKGMDKETAAKIFDPFFTTKEMGKGTGLGLAVVYGIIMDHQGHVSVYSEPGSGTVLTVYLPLIEERHQGMPTEITKEKPPGGDETILLAEDDWTVRELFARVLGQAGYTVLPAINGEEAVRTFTEHRDAIDLVVFDLIMPKMNGKQALEAIQRVRPEIKGVFVSGYAPENIRQKDLLDIHMEILYKPVSPKELLRTVRMILDTP